MRISHDKQETNITEDKQAVRASHWNGHGAPSVLFCSDVVGTDSKVLTLKQCELEESDCQDGGFRVLRIFLSFSCLTASPSKDDSSDILWMKEREAPTIGSG